MLGEGEIGGGFGKPSRTAPGVMGAERQWSECQHHLTPDRLVKVKVSQHFPQLSSVGWEVSPWGLGLPWMRSNLLHQLQGAEALLQSAWSSLLTLVLRRFSSLGCPLNWGQGKKAPRCGHAMAQQYHLFFPIWGKSIFDLDSIWEMTSTKGDYNASTLIGCPTSGFTGN